MSGATPTREWGMALDGEIYAVMGGRWGRCKWPPFVTEMTEPSGITKFEVGMGAGLKM